MAMNDCALFFHFIFSSCLFFFLRKEASTINVEFWFHVSMDFAVGWWRGGVGAERYLIGFGIALFHRWRCLSRQNIKLCYLQGTSSNSHWVRGKWHYLRSTQYCWFSALICFSKRNHPLCSVGKNYIVDTIIHFFVRVLLFNNHINIHYSQMISKL